MVLPGSSDNTPFAEKVIQASHNPLVTRIIAVIAIVAVICVYQAGQNVSSSLEEASEDYHHVFSQPTAERCLDADDPKEYAPTVCQCADPIKPSRRNMALWDQHHDRMVQTARKAKRHGLDFCILGDSIIERWGFGTRRMGSIPAPEYQESFQELFDNKQGSTQLQGLALGSAGDTSTELLWHLQNGMLPDTLRPKVWIILIGTNDMGSRGCSKRNTLAGILHVAQYIHTQRPNTPIILHGLLPRSDEMDSRSLGIQWKQIMWINRELKRFCALHNEWHYMEAGSLFLKKTKGGEDLVEIDDQTMEDGLHPTIVGYEEWGPLIAQQVQTLAKKKNN